MKRILDLFFVVSLFLLLTIRVDAGTFLNQDEVQISAGTKHSHEADVHGSFGQIEVTRSKFNLEEKFKAGEVPLSFYVSSENMDLNENITLELPTHLVATTVGLGVKLPMPFLDQEHYFLGVDVLPSMYREDWAWKSGSFRIPFRVYGIYKQSESLIAVAGAYVRPEFEDRVLPIVGVIWKPNDRLSFNLASDDPNITYKLNDQWTLLTEFGYANGEYEVTRGGQNGTVLQYRETSTGVGFKYAFTKNWEAKVSAGGVFGRQLKYRDGAGKLAAAGSIYTDVKLEGKF